MGDAPRGRHDARLARDVRQELEHHLAACTEYLIEQGLPADAAEAEARRRLGPVHEAESRLVPYARDRERTMKIRDWMQSVMQDVQYAARNLKRQPVLTLLVVGTLALGIGANAAMFGILDRLLVSGPAHVEDVDELVRVYFTRTPDAGPPSTYTRTNYAAYSALRAAGSFKGLAAYHTIEEMMGRGAEARRVRVQQASWTLFPLLGVEPVLGRFFGAAEDTPPVGMPVAVLSHAFWARQFAADAAVLGRTVTMQDRTFTVIGVAPRGFSGVELERVDLWVPVSAGLYAPRADWTTTWGALWLKIVGRLAPGVDRGVAGEEATAIHRAAYGGPQTVNRQIDLSVRPILHGDDGEEPMEASVSRWLVGVAAVVLLIACANVSSLLLARGIQRRREIVLRSALGISRGRLVRLLAAEACVLALAGGAAALAVAHWGGGIIQAVLLPDVVWDGVASGGRLLLFTAGATVATVLIIAPLPALQGLRIRLTDSLKDGGQQSGRLRAPVRYGLTVVQAALSVVLLVGAGLFVESLIRVERLDLGIEAGRVMTASLSWPDLSPDLEADARRAERDRRQTVTMEAVAHLRSLPGVSAASASIGLPFWSGFGIELRVPGMAEMPELPGGGPYVAAIGDGYFDTVGTEVVRGRRFRRDEGAGTAPVVIVSQTMADTLWPGRQALGECLHIGPGEPPCSEVVGIAEDTRRFRLREEPAMQYYVPLGQERSIAGVTLLVRPAGDVATTGETLERALLALDPTLHYVAVRTLQEQIDPQVRPWRLGASLFTAFGALAFVIAALGLYSVVAYVTQQRTREMGIRLALGAQTSDVLRLVLGGGLVVAAAGIGLGVVCALAVSPALEPLLFDTSARSPVVYGVVTAVLLVTALAASLVPARRATRVDPVVALRP